MRSLSNCILLLFLILIFSILSCESKIDIIEKIIKKSNEYFEQKEYELAKTEITKVTWVDVFELMKKNPETGKKIEKSIIKTWSRIDIITELPENLLASYEYGKALNQVNLYLTDFPDDAHIIAVKDQIETTIEEATIHTTITEVANIFNRLTTSNEKEDYINGYLYKVVIWEGIVYDMKEEYIDLEVNNNIKVLLYFDQDMEIDLNKGDRIKYKAVCVKVAISEYANFRLNLIELI